MTLNTYKSNVNKNLFSGDSLFQETIKSLASNSGAVTEILKQWELNIPRWEQWANEASRPEKLPRVEKYDNVGNSVEDIKIALETSLIREEVVKEGIFKNKTELEKFARIYLLAQIGESGVTCPLACTDGLVRVVQTLGSDYLKQEYLEKLQSEQFPLAGAQFITEQAGGSDVGAIEGTAKANSDGTYSIHAFKWYCSAFDEFFLMAARPEGAPIGTEGIAIFFVPRVLQTKEGSKVNSYSIRRLKNKLGTQSLPTAEIDFQGSIGYLLGKKEDGFHHLMNYILNVSRVHNAANSLGFHRRAFLEARNYAQHREAFGKKLIEFPLIQEYLLDMSSSLVLKRSCYFSLLQRLDDKGWFPEDNNEKLWNRFLINLMKYRTAFNLTEMVKTGILVFGANGIIEDFSIMPRLLRDSLIVETWEGPHNTLCLQIMRDSKRFDFWSLLKNEIESVVNAWPETQAQAKKLYLQQKEDLFKLSALLKTSEQVQMHARRVVDLTALLLEVGAVIKEYNKSKKSELLDLVLYFLEKASAGVDNQTWFNWSSDKKEKIIRSC